MTPPLPLRTACSKLFLLDKSVSAFPRCASSRIFSASVKRNVRTRCWVNWFVKSQVHRLSNVKRHVDVGHQCTFSIAFGILRKTRL
jgi:hypothetical protein